MSPSQKEKMMEKVELVYPFYMDIPMMISFVAAMHGGYSLENSWTLTNDSAGEITGTLEGEAGLSQIMSNLIRASLKASGNIDGKLAKTEESQIVIKHTEASLFMQMRHELFTQKRLISIDNYTEDQWKTLQPSNLIEMSGEIHRSPINEIAQITKRWLPIILQSSMPLNTDGSVNFSALTDEQKKELYNMSIMQAIVADLESLPLSDILLKHKEGWAKSAVLDLSTKVMSLMDQELLHCGRVTVFGKVTRFIGRGEKINLYRRSMLGVINDNILDQLTSELTALPDMKMFQIEAPTVEYPAIEVIPMAIYI